MKKLQKLIRFALVMLFVTCSFVVVSPAASSQAASGQLQNGADVSWLPEIEQSGSKFYDSKGRRVDALVMMKRAGLKVARVRLWVSPPTKRSSLTEVLSLAKRIKKAGLALALDIHYSDWWADPGHQTTPETWRDLTQPQLVAKVEQYTSQVLASFAKQKTSPKWVQVGNEIGNGMLWPLGQLPTYSKAEFTNLVELLNAASKAVRSSAGKPKVVLHLETGGDAVKTKYWLEGTLQNGLTLPDAFAISYYSQWGGPLSNLGDTITLIKQTLNVPIVVAETAYPFTSTSKTHQVIDASKAGLAGLEISPTGQASYATSICEMLRMSAQDKAVGVWWWEAFSPNTSKLKPELAASTISSSSLVTGRGRANPAMISLGKCK